MNLTSWRFFFLAPVNPSFYSSIQIFHFSNARNTFYIHIVGRVDIFFKYLSSFVVSTIYIFNNLYHYELNIHRCSVFPRLNVSFTLSTKFPLNSRQLFGNLNRSFTRILCIFCIEMKTREYIYKRVEERLWRQLYLSRSNRGWNFLKFHIRIERIRVGMNSRRVHRSKYVKLKALVDWLHRVQP